MYTVHTSAPPFKDNRLRSQVPTWAATLAYASDQFRSSWSPKPNHTPRMRMGPSLQRKGPGRGMTPLQAPRRKPSLLSKLILVPAICSYLATTFFTAFMSKRQDTKTDIISVRGYLCQKRTNKRNAAQGRPCFLIPKPTEQGIQSADIVKRRQVEILPDRPLQVLPVHLHHCLRVVVHQC